MNSSSGKQVTENQFAEGHQEIGQRPPLRRQDASEEILSKVQSEVQQPKQKAGLATNAIFTKKKDSSPPLFYGGGRHFLLSFLQ